MKKVKDGYVYEWCYPSAALFPLKLEPGKRFRLSLGVFDRDWIGADGKVVREKDEKDSRAKFTALGGLNFGCFLANVDSRPEKWREFLLTE